MKLIVVTAIIVYTMVGVVAGLTGVQKIHQGIERTLVAP